MKTHDHRLPANPEEWADAFANSFGQEYCTRCAAALSPALSITSALDVGSGVPSLTRTLMGVRREYGPWAVICLCFGCGDVAVWPITEAQRRALVDELCSLGSEPFADPA